MNELKNIFHRLRETKVLENYSFMTALSILSALIGLVIYPFVIRATGKDAYGTYVYAFTIASVFHVILDFGFDSPCAKAVVKARFDLKELSRIVSGVFMIKLGFTIVCGIAFAICIFLVPFMHEHFTLCLTTFIQLIATTFFPVWYFQGLKKMKIVTYINLGLRLCTIPLIICLVHAPEDIELYALIVMLSIVLGTLISYLFLHIDGIHFQWTSKQRLQVILCEATPFFATSLAGSLKAFALKTIVKTWFGIGEVAVYDLAEKIVTLPRFFTQNINGALFPEVVEKATNNRIRRILKYERVIGLSLVALMVLLSYPAVLFLGGEEMIGAVPITIVLSSCIYTGLVAGAYINFIFVPQNQYYLITVNQIISLFTSVFIALIGLLIWHNVIMVAGGIMLSGFFEILFCRYHCKKMEL